MEKVGLIGLGNMGKNMARNLVKGGFDLTVYDVREEPVKEMMEQGAKGAGSLEELGQACDMIFVMVMNFPQVQSCVLGDGGVLNYMKEDSTLIVTSTIAPTEIIQVAEAAAKKGIHVIDSPVSGGVKGAASGTLMMMVAAEDKIYERCKDAIKAVGSKATKVGDKIGMGQTVKAANQLLVSVHSVAMAEAMTLAVAAGADPQITYDIITQSAGNSTMFEDKVPYIMDRDFQARGALEVQLKDLEICLKTGKDYNVPLPTTAASREIFIHAKGMGLAREDLCSLVKVFEQASNVTVEK